MVQTTAEWQSIHFQNSTATIAWPDYVAYLGQLKVQIPTAVPNSLLYHEPGDNWWQRPLAGWHTQHLVAQSKRPVLIVRQPRWPLQQVLLVARGEKGDETAVSWAEILAQASGAVVAILPIIPPWPAMYQQGNQVQADLDVILQPNTSTGQRLHQYRERLERVDVPNYFCQQPGAPDQQIRQEVAQINHDLIIVASDLGGRLERWFWGDLVAPLLYWADRPLLITK